MALKCLIFDFDGTLADTSACIVRTMSGTLEEMGLPVVSPEEIRNVIGLALKDSLRKGAHVPEERVDEAVDIYHRIFKEIAEESVTLFPGVKETVEALHSEGYMLAVATSRGYDSLNHLMGLLGIRDLFSVLSTVECAGRPKPAPDTVNHVLEKMSLRPDEVLVIGDTTYDILMGAAAGCATCGVSYGNHSAAQLQSADPDWIVGDIRELPGVVHEAQTISDLSFS